MNLTNIDMPTKEEIDQAWQSGQDWGMAMGRWQAQAQVAWFGSRRFEIPRFLLWLAERHYSRTVPEPKTWPVMHTHPFLSLAQRDGYNDGIRVGYYSAIPKPPEPATPNPYQSPSPTL